MRAKLLTLAAALFTISTTLSALNPGDVRIFSYLKAVGGDNITLILLAPTSGDEEIFITNRVYDPVNGVFTSANKGWIKYKFPSSPLPVGTLIKLKDLRHDPKVASGSPGQIVETSLNAIGKEFHPKTNNPVTIFTGTSANDVVHFVSGFTFGVSPHDYSNYPNLNTNRVTVLSNLKNNQTAVLKTPYPTNLADLEAYISDSTNWNFGWISQQPIVDGGQTIQNITPTSTEWINGAWTNGAPDDKMEAIISENITVNQFTCFDLIIAPGVEFLVNPMGRVVVKSSIDNQGKVILKADNTGYAQFAPVPVITNAGVFDVDQYFDGPTAWYQIGVPVSGASVEDLANTANGGGVWVTGSRANVFFWDANTSNWEAPSSLSEVLSPAKGYTAYMGKKTNTKFIDEMPLTISLSGTPVLQSTSVGLTYDDASNSNATFSDPNAKDGWNFLSNPFPAAYNWQNTEVDPNMPGGSSGTPIYINRQGIWAAYANGIGINGGSRYLAPYQAFFIRVSNQVPAQHQFQSTRVVTEQMPDILKTSQDEQNDRAVLRIVAKDASRNFEDETAIIFGNFNNEVIDGEDAHKLVNTMDYPNLASMSDGLPLSINSRADVTGADTIQLRFDYQHSGMVSLIFDYEGGSPNFDAFLVDNWTNSITEIGQAYSFAHDEAYPNDRFQIVFARNSVSVDKFNLKAPESWVFANGDEDVLKLSNDNTVQIFDMNGRMISKFNGISGNNELPNLSRGMYIIQIGNDIQTERIKWVVK